MGLGGLLYLHADGGQELRRVTTVNGSVITKDKGEHGRPVGHVGVTGDDAHVTSSDN